MTLEAAFNAFWNQFGVKAYPDTQVPNGAEMPYLTYQVRQGLWNDIRSITVQLRNVTNSEKSMNEVERAIMKKLGIGGYMLHCDGGYVQLYWDGDVRLAEHIDDDNILKTWQMNITAKYYIQEV